MKEWLYVINQKNIIDVVKVGITRNDPRLRMMQIDSTGSPYPLNLAYSVLVEEGRKLEKIVHDKLKHKKFHMRGEWFNCLIETAITEVKKVTKNSALYENYTNPTQRFISELESSEDYRFHILSAEKGVPTSQYYIAVLYDFGDEGIMKNYNRAFYWYLKAAKQGHIESQYSIATMYENGQGVQKNTGKAEYWYLKASKNGHANSRFNLELLNKKSNQKLF